MPRSARTPSPADATAGGTGGHGTAWRGVPGGRGLLRLWLLLW